MLKFYRVSILAFMLGFSPMLYALESGRATFSTGILFQNTQVDFNGETLDGNVGNVGYGVDFSLGYAVPFSFREKDFQVVLEGFFDTTSGDYDFDTSEGHGQLAIRYSYGGRLRPGMFINENSLFFFDFGLGAGYFEADLDFESDFAETLFFLQWGFGLQSRLPFVNDNLFLTVAFNQGYYEETEQHPFLNHETGFTPMTQNVIISFTYYL